jgi:ADP-heptose:LPS heptosyltransferase
LVRHLFTHFSLQEKNKEIHERDRYLNILSSLNYELIEAKKQYWKNEGLPSLKWLPKDTLLEFGFSQNKKIILINPTASIREKAWESKNFRELALKLKAQGVEVRIIGSPKETEWLKEVAQNDFSIIQPSNILNIVDILKYSSLLITNTSSMQFIAAGTKTPTITLMGCASPLRWGSLGTSSICLKQFDINMNMISNTNKLFSSKKKLNKLNESIAYNSIPVNLVLEKVLLKMMCMSGL